MTEGTTGDGFLRFEYETGVEVVVNGDESRRQLAQRVVEHMEAISGRAVRLLESFMRDRGAFKLSSVEVFAEKTPQGGDFSLWYTFISDCDPHEYGYTYFEVYFSCCEPPGEPFWPFKFTVGFH
jgi:hypothetical protein